MGSRFARRRSVLFTSFVFFALAAIRSAQAQQPPAADLFFSEYIEGSSNNKALEIYNGTGADLNLAAGSYNVQVFFNGSVTAGLTMNLAGTVGAWDVFVLAHSSASAAILAQANQTNGSGWFNGDDAVVLRKGTMIIDVIGQIGLDPGTEWGAGATSTADNTLRRKCTIAAGDTSGSDSFDPSPQWDGLPTDSFDGLGQHCTAPPPPPPAPVLTIHEIQGSGLVSPFAGQAAKTLGNIVTAVGGNGFFVQTPEAAVDSDPQTSEGIFVFTGAVPAVQVGDVVDVAGTATEFFGLTEINSSMVTVTRSGVPLPSPVTFDRSTPSPTDPDQAAQLERYEGMLVRINAGVTTGPTNAFGETPIVAGSARAFREPGILYPGLPGLPVWDGNPEIIEMDFGGLGQPDVSLVAGTSIEYVEGPLGFAFGDYQIWPTAFSAAAGPALPRPVRERAAGELTVGSQNLLRLFDTVDDPDTDDPLSLPAQYAARLSKVSLLIRDVLRSPYLLALQEVENLDVLRDLAIQIAVDDPSIRYSPYLFEGNDIGGIDVGFLVRDTVRVDSVTQFGATDSFVFGTTVSLLNDRPPLVLRGAYTGNGAAFPFVLINVHQRSLSGIEGSDGPRIRAKRYEQAYRLSQYVQDLQTSEPGVRLIAVGDFNAFEFTDGYVDVMGQVTGLLDPSGALLPGIDVIEPNLTNHTVNMPPAERYSFVFEGTAQSLDHVLTSTALAAFVRGAEHARGNADLFVGSEFTPTTALRSSDHDGTVLFLMTDYDADLAPDDADNCRAAANATQSDVDGDGIGDACDMPVERDECKNDGWQIFTGLPFTNQGQCVAFVESRRRR